VPTSILRFWTDSARWLAEDGIPRLLDFGTAKTLSPAPGDPGSQLTREGYFSFTPQYASPEQILGSPITTATDTYSLGVLLYLLLTGSPPYELKDLTTAEMLRTVCEEAPRRPSRADRSGGRLDPDLEAILLKALRKEPQERYLTVESLAGDLRGSFGQCRRSSCSRLCKFPDLYRSAIAVNRSPNPASPSRTTSTPVRSAIKKSAAAKDSIE